MMRRHVFLSFLFVSSLATLGAAETPSPEAGRAVERQLIDAERQRFAAMVEADVGTLERLLADELTYTHTTGTTDTKTELLASLSSGTLKYLSIEPEDMRARPYGEVGVVTGRAAMKVRAGGQELAFRIAFTDVYVRRDGRWQVVAWQSTRLPGESAGAGRAGDR